MGGTAVDCAFSPRSCGRSSLWQTTGRTSCAWRTASPAIATAHVLAATPIDRLLPLKRAASAPSSRLVMSNRGHGGPQRVGSLRRRPQLPSCSPRRNIKAFLLPCGSPYHPHGRPSSPYHPNGRQQAVTGMYKMQEQAGRNEVKKKIGRNYLSVTTD